MQVNIDKVNSGVAGVGEVSRNVSMLGTFLCSVAVSVQQEKRSKFHETVTYVLKRRI